MFDRPPSIPAPNWLLYIRAANLEGALEKVRLTAAGHPSTRSGSRRSRRIAPRSRRPSTTYAVTLLLTAYRGRRVVFYSLLLLWHLAFSTVVFTGVLSDGADATMQGQGLHWEFPLWGVGVPCALFTLLAGAWVVLDHRAGGAALPVRWGRANTRKLVTSLVLLGVGLVCFRAGTNYNWLTAVAVVLTVLHWILLAVSFESPATRRA